ncbi:uncharacterized protein LOC124595806 [Schistocerca americana]|uniref:uncharacterized protein LOC124595806 n=1 Tax=Schistocerca americana TaxID=7009 RepID=UPI001F4F44BE|nr:uncharacterized protein LOC124595806 [Schistocerca americana]
MDDRWVIDVSAASLPLLLFLLVATGPASSQTSLCRVQDCPNYKTIRYYEEVGCVPSATAGNCCPTHFDCSFLLSLDRTKCHYEGKAYEPGADISGVIKSVCIPVCSCFGVTEGPSRGEARFSCASSGCAGYRIPEGKESFCYPTYKVDQCCGTGIKCANDTKSPRNVAECPYKGKTYLEGQFIEGTQSKCMRCVCQKGYDGSLKEPWCRRQSCDYSLWWTVSQLQKCAPIFDEDDACCAHDYHCPSTDPIAVQHSESSTPNEGGQCAFGDHKLKIGDYFLSSGRDCIKCKCDTPPFITCVKLPVGYCPVAKK